LVQFVHMLVVSCMIALFTFFVLFMVIVLFSLVIISQVSQCSVYVLWTLSGSASWST